MRKISSLLPLIYAVVLFVPILGAPSCNVGYSMKITDLRVNEFSCPLGDDDDRPEFSWKTDSPVQEQTAYRIIVARNPEQLKLSGKEKLSAKGIIWDSGKQYSQKSSYIEYSGNSLLPRSRYFWKVLIWDQNDKVHESSGNDWFETGLMHEASILETGWLAGDSRQSAPMFRKEFKVDKPKLSQVRFYATAAGIYEVYINGEKIGNSYFNPGRTQYPTRTMYQTFDITDYIINGGNAIGVIIGKGWMAGANANFNFGDSPHLGFTAAIILKYEDGTEDIIRTDDSWLFRTDGPILENDIFQGEIYDARKEEPEWANFGFSSDKWKAPDIRHKSDFLIGDIVCQAGPSVRNVSVLPAVSVSEPVKGVFVYDFGQNLTGICRIKVKGKPGHTIKMRHGEKLNGEMQVNRDDSTGTIWTSNLNICKNEDIYTMRGDPDGEIFEPSLVYRGFQYMQLTGVDEAVPIENIHALVIASDLEKTGYFECSDTLLNKFVKNAEWSMTDNFLSVPTDCPQRNERLGWTGDARIFARTASYMKNVNSMFHKYMTDVRDGANGRGIYPVFSPAPALAHKVAAGGWSDAGVFIPWTMYLHYGDTSHIYENYDSMCRYVDTIISDCDNYIDREGRYMGDMFGDWESCEHTPIVITETAFCARSTKLLSLMAEVIGRKEDAEKYATHFANFKKAWNREFVNPDGSMKCDPKKYGTGVFGNMTDPENGIVNSQTAYAIGLQFDLFNDKTKAAAKLSEIIRNGDYRLKAGFAGIDLLNPALTEAGYGEDAYRLMLQREFPSWLFATANGATSIYESWQSYIQYPDGKYRYLISLNHFPYASVVEWLYRYVGGIEADIKEPGFKKIILQPLISGSLSFTKCSYLSGFGSIESHWEAENGQLTSYRAVIPSNTTARLFLPIGSEMMTGAKYQTSGVTFAGMGTRHGRPCAIFNLKPGKYIFRTTNGQLEVN